MDVSNALRFVESCIDRYAEQAWRTAYVMLSNAADADDLLQQAWLVAWRKADSAPRDNAWPWLAAIIAHEARNFRRKRSRRRGPSLDSISEPAMENDPNKNLERVELAALVHISLAELDEDQRIAIVLTHLGGLSQTEAAIALGLPLNTLKARVRRGLDNLREALGRSAPNLENMLKTLPVAPPAGGLIAAKAAWSAGLATNVAIAGGATAAAGGIKALVATAAAALVLTVGVVAAVTLPEPDRPQPYVAQDIRDEPAPARPRVNPAPPPLENRATPEPESESKPVPKPEPKPSPAPEAKPEPDPKSEPSTPRESTTRREMPPRPPELPEPVGLGSGENDGFWEVWRDKKATCLDKYDAVCNLIGGGELLDEYLEILESDVWQYRANIAGRIQHETNRELLQRLESFLFDEKEVAKKPAAGEHVCWALYNNRNWVTEEKWLLSRLLVTSKKTPDKVKARMLRELGVFRRASDDRDAQKAARTNVQVLVELLEVAVLDKKYSRELKFLIFDALESLSSQDFGDDLDKWKFFANNMKESAPLIPRAADAFKDSFTNIELEGRSFASATPRLVDMEVLVLSEFGSSDRYWQPYIHEINKTFKCSFIDLPDCSRLRDVEWMRNRDGTANRDACYLPIKEFVETLEDRKQSKQKQVGLIAHGFGAWIAMEYMRLHPESVAFAVIIGTWSGQSAYETALHNLSNSKDEAFKYFGESLSYDPSGRTGQLSLSDEQEFQARTGQFKRRWADPKALEPIFYAQPDWQIPPRRPVMLVPKFELDTKRKIDVPTLFIHGAKDPMFVAKDEGDYKRAFRNMTWAVFENSAATPWAEEPVRFFDEFQALLEKNKIIEKLKK